MRDAMRDGAGAARPPAEDGDRRARRSRRLRPEARPSGGAVIQVFQVAARPGRRAGRAATAEAADVARRRRGGDARRRCSSSTSCATPPRGDLHCRSRSRSREALEAWLSARGQPPGASWSCRSAATSGRLVDLATRNAELVVPAPASTTPAAQSDGARDAAARCWRCRSLPRRIECFDISTHPGQRDRRLDGGLRGRPDAPGASTASSASPMPPRRCWAPRPRGGDSWTTSRRCPGRAAAFRASCSSSRRPVSRPDADRRRQGPAVRGLRGARSARAGQPGGHRLAKKEELLFTRDSRSSRLPSPRTSPALLLLQRIRDEAHRFAVTFHRQARTMRDLRSELDDVPGHRTAPAAGAADPFRQPGRRAPRHARGARAAGRARSAPTPC